MKQTGGYREKLYNKVDVDEKMVRFRAETTRRTKKLPTSNFHLETLAFLSLLLQLALHYPILKTEAQSLASPTEAQASREKAQSDQAANFVASILQAHQISACDGEQLELSCNDNYALDINTVVYSVLKETRRSSFANGNEQPPPASPNFGGQSLQQPKPICAPLPVAQQNEQQQQEQLHGKISKQEAGSPERQATNATIISQHQLDSSDGFSSCDAKSADESSARDQATVLSLVKKLCQSQNKCTLDLRYPLMMVNNISLNAVGDNNSSASFRPPGDYNSTNATVTSTTNSSNNNDATIKGRNINSNNDLNWRLDSTKLAKLMASGSCAPNRKLLEIVYKCRPQKLGRRAVCRGQQLALDCPIDRQLVITSGGYGASPSEKKLNDKCSIDNRQASVVVLAPTNDNPNSTSLSDGLAKQACQSNRTMDILMLQCNFKQNCRLEVSAKVFGETHCPANQPEYLILIYACIPSGQLNHNRTRALVQSRQLLLSNNNNTTTLSSSSMLSTLSNNTPANIMVAKTQQILTQPPVVVSTSTNNLDTRQQRNQNLPAVSEPTAAPTGGGGGGGSSINELAGGDTNVFNDEQQQDQLISPPMSSITSPNHHSNAQFGFLSNIGYFSRQNSTQIANRIATDPQLASTDPSLWSLPQRLKFFWLYYRPEILSFALLLVSTSLLILLARGCFRILGSPKRSSIRSSISSHGSSSISKSAGGSSTELTSSSKSSYGANCSSTANAYTCPNMNYPQQLRNQQLQQQSHNNHNQNNGNNSKQQHNSCSESCFSLDDYHFLGDGGGSLSGATTTAGNFNANNNDNDLSAANSPGYHSNSGHNNSNRLTPMDSLLNRHHHQHLCPSNTNASDSIKSTSGMQMGGNNINQLTNPGYLTTGSYHSNSGARPKLWSLYNNEQRVVGNNNNNNFNNLTYKPKTLNAEQLASSLGAQCASLGHQTMRATRTFLGSNDQRYHQQQHQHQHQNQYGDLHLAALQNDLLPTSIKHSPQQRATQQTNSREFGGGGGGGISEAADYLQIALGASALHAQQQQQQQNQWANQQTQMQLSQLQLQHDNNNNNQAAILQAQCAYNPSQYQHHQQQLQQSQQVGASLPAATAAPLLQIVAPTQTAAAAQSHICHQFQLETPQNSLLPSMTGQSASIAAPAAATSAAQQVIQVTPVIFQSAGHQQQVAAGEAPRATNSNQLICEPPPANGMPSPPPPPEQQQQQQQSGANCRATP